MDVSAAVQQKLQKENALTTQQRRKDADLMVTILAHAMRALEEQLTRGEFMLDRNTHAVVLATRVQLYHLRPTDFQIMLQIQLEQRLPKAAYILEGIDMMEDGSGKEECMYGGSVFCCIALSIWCWPWVLCCSCPTASVDATGPYAVRIRLRPAGHAKI